MAFNPKNFAAGAGTSDYRSDLASYGSTDPIATVMAAGYFPTIPGRVVNPGFDESPVGLNLRAGDFTYVNSSDAQGIFYCAASGTDLLLQSIGMDNILP